MGEKVVNVPIKIYTNSAKKHPPQKENQDIINVFYPDMEAKSTETLAAPLNF